MSTRMAFQGLPKQLSKQLSQIKKDKEQEDKLHSSSKGDKVGKLQSDIISNNQRGGNSSDEERSQRWEKVKLPGITKTIRKVNVKREHQADQNNNVDGQWTKNCDISNKSSNSGNNQIDYDERPKKKITICRDEKGRAHFKEDIIDSSKGNNAVRQQSRSLELKRPVIQLKNRKQQNNEDIMEQEISAQSGQSQSEDNEDDVDYDQQRGNNYDQDSLDQEYEHTQQKQYQQSKGKSVYIEISNLPRQIDNAFLKDLLKKEKDHLLDSYKTDNKGKVKLDSRESAERSITLLNKRTLYGQTIQAYIINEDQFHRSSGSTQGKAPVIQRIAPKRTK